MEPTQEEEQEPTYNSVQSTFDPLGFTDFNLEFEDPFADVNIFS